MSALCLLAAGAMSVLPYAEFTLEWTHSVHKVRWEERYRVEADALRLVRASAEGNGAGLEIPPDARRSGARWVWHPDRVLRSVTLAHSGFGGDYRLCTAAGCTALSELAPREHAVTLAACAANASGRG